MSNFGQNTEQALKNLLHGLLKLKSPQQKGFQNQPTWQNQDHWLRRFTFLTTHKEADDEVAALKARYLTVKTVADEWRQKVDTLVKEWELLDNTVTDLNAWVAKDKTTEGENQFSLEKMESTLGELKNIFKQKEKLVDNL